LGYLGHGEGLVIHRTECSVALRLTRKDDERMIEAHWADDIERAFTVGMVVSVKDGQGVLAQVTSALAQADANIVHIEMGQEQAEHMTDLRFRIAINDVTHLDQVKNSGSRVLGCSSGAQLADSSCLSCCIKPMRMTRLKR
jgi:GTP diphosphokinase / guanosine-3',5'-bis(diphosphate) 3'-diphosphatase